MMSLHVRIMSVAAIKIRHTITIEIPIHVISITSQCCDVILSDVYRCVHLPFYGTN